MADLNGEVSCADTWFNLSKELQFEGRSWKLEELERAGALKNSGRSLASKFELPQEMRVWPGSCRFFPTKILTRRLSGHNKLSLDSKVVWSQQVDLPDKQKNSSEQSKWRHVRIKPLNFETRWMNIRTCIATLRVLLHLFESRWIKERINVFFWHLCIATLHV